MASGCRTGEPKNNEGFPLELRRGFPSTDVTQDAIASELGGFTEDSIPFADSNGILTEDNANLSWDGDTLLVGTDTPNLVKERALIESAVVGEPALRVENTSVSGTRPIFYCYAAGSLVLSVVSTSVSSNVPFIFTTNTTTLTGNITLTTATETFLFLNPDTLDRDVTLPAESGFAGGWYTIINTVPGTAKNLVVKDVSSATIITIGKNEIGRVFCNGTKWWGFVGQQAP